MRTVLTRTMAAALLVLPLAACSDDDNVTDVEDRNIVELAAETGSLTTLATAIDVAGLEATLEGDGPFTIFAPDDAAFDALPEGTLEALLADPAALADILTYHVVAGAAVTSDEVVNLSEATTVNGNKVEFTFENGLVFVNGAQVTGADVEASNGVIHIIDAVLLPPM